MDTNRFRILFGKYLQGTLDEQEQHELDAYIPLLDEAAFSEIVDELVQVEENGAFRQEAVFQDILNRIETQQQPTADTKIRSSKTFVAGWQKVAAGFLLAGFLGLMLYNLSENGQHSSNALTSVSSPASSHDLELPQEHALITLADGKQMSLDEIQEDTIRYKGLEIMRLGDGTVVMKQDQTADFFLADEKHQFSAPRGTSLRLILPDASAVQLNSNSNMQIYASFGKKQRQVDLSGEAFFEVAHNKDLPFVVNAKNTKVRVLGTKFNVSAYREDRQVKTTLLSGSVQVDAEQSRLRIAPGQQAIVHASNNIQLKEDVDMNSVLAWLDGYFRFRDEPIQSIIADLAKWYPIEGVEFRNGSSDKFTGSLKRSKKLRDVLQNIEQVSDLRFDIQEGRVIVMK